MRLGDGRSTSFWFDDWHAKGPLFIAYPTLFTHTTRAQASVHTVLSGTEPTLHVRPRLTHAAAVEQTDLNSALMGTHLADAPDERFMDGSVRGGYNTCCCLQSAAPYRRRQPGFRHHLENRCAFKDQIFCLAPSTWQDKYAGQPAP